MHRSRSHPLDPRASGLLRQTLTGTCPFLAARRRYTAYGSFVTRGAKPPYPHHQVRSVSHHRRASALDISPHSTVRTMWACHPRARRHATHMCIWPSEAHMHAYVHVALRGARVYRPRGVQASSQTTPIPGTSRPLSIIQSEPRRVEPSRAEPSRVESSRVEPPRRHSLHRMRLQSSRVQLSPVESIASPVESSGVQSSPSRVESSPVQDSMATSTAMHT